MHKKISIAALIAAAGLATAGGLTYANEGESEAADPVASYSKAEVAADTPANAHTPMKPLGSD